MVSNREVGKDSWPHTDGGRGPQGWQGGNRAKRTLEPDGFCCLSQGGSPRVVFTPGEPCLRATV